MRRRMFLSLSIVFFISFCFFEFVVANEKTFISQATGANFVLIPAGTFMMGDVSKRQMEITKPFYMQTTEVTQGQWQKVMGNNPSLLKDCGENCPVENISWVDVQEFVRRLNQVEGTNKYRLPTEAEWEYACRAGTQTKYPFGDSAHLLDEYAWFDKNSGRRTNPVAKKKPNAWGLYDMQGNVSEWCHDWYGDYPSAKGSDYKGPASGHHKVIRGGAWLSSAQTVNCSSRGNDFHVVRCYDIGFRLARDF